VSQILADIQATTPGFCVPPSDVGLVCSWVAAWERDASSILSGIWIPEMTFAYCPAADEGRELPGVNPRHAWRELRPDELSGAADVVVMNGRDSLEVWDIKTGRIDNVTPVAENAQLRFLSLAAARAYGRSRVRAGIAYVSEDGVQAETAEFGEAEFIEIRRDLVRMLERIDAHEPPHAGAHCRYCPARASCPTTLESISAIVPAKPEPWRVVSDRQAIQSDEHASWLLGMVRRVRQAADDVETALRVYADDTGGIQTGPGLMWCRREIAVERLSVNADAEALLRADLPEALTLGVTKSSIEAAARARKLPVAKTKAEMLARLRAVGAVNESVTVRYEER
jgi:hypothetical protein